MNTCSENAIPTIDVENEKLSDVLSGAEVAGQGDHKSPETLHELLKLMASMRNAAPADEADVAPAEDEEEEDDADVEDEELSDDEDAEDGEHRGLGNLHSLQKLIAAMNDTDSDDEDDFSFDDDEEECGNVMDADDYHNKACGYARKGNLKSGIEVCLKGLKYFPRNVDLLADIIQYSSESGDWSTAAKYYGVLRKTIPFHRWNWRAFTFSARYLLDEDPVENEAECRMLISNYKKYIPYEEKICMVESELEEALGNRERSMQVLEEAIATRSNASQCALRLMDKQMDRGMFEEAVHTANYGMAASAEAQPSINMPYLCYLRALAKDHLLHKKECMHEPVSQKEVDAMVKEYKLLMNEFPVKMMHFRSNIHERISMLAFIQTTD